MPKQIAKSRQNHNLRSSRLNYDKISDLSRITKSSPFSIFSISVNLKHHYKLFQAISSPKFSVYVVLENSSKKVYVNASEGSRTLRTFPDLSKNVHNIINNSLLSSKPKHIFIHKNTRLPKTYIFYRIDQTLFVFTRILPKEHIQYSNTKSIQFISIR